MIGKRQGRGKAWLRGFMALVLAFGLLGAAPGAALADDVSATSSWAAAVKEMESPGYSPYSYVNSGVMALSAENEALPEKFDLREKGVVTPVKFQNPWGTCWGFSAIAASETSILSEMGTTYAETPLDLSERQLAYFAYKPAPAYAGDQAREGAHYTGDNPNFMFNLGGLMVYATTLFSAGVGPLHEKYVPYRNDEGKIVYIVRDAEGNVTTEVLTPEEAAKLPDDKTALPWYYADTIPAPTESDPDAKVPATWAVGDDWWIASSYELEESNVLPDLRVFDAGLNYTGYNQNAMDAVKRELVDGRAVSMAFCADTSKPNESGKANYINANTWAHYTYEPAAANHAVTIVGWDDGYSKDNFISDHQPLGDGAWIVKNSWGSDEQEFPNRNGWGALNDKGENTGYFYLSYYDQSIQMLETFDYDLAPYTEAPDYLIDQYNLLIAGNTLVNSYDKPAPSANVFKAEGDRTVRTIACETVKPNTTVTYRLYLLDGDAADPTDGTLAAEEEATYEYGGYHRMALADDKWVPMREGQRYSVVVTQYCNDDDKYYQSAASNRAKIPEETVAEIRAQLTQMFTETIWNGIYQEAYQTNIDKGTSEEEAKAAAEAKADEVIKLKEVQDAIESMVEERLAGITSLYYEARVNPGESFTFDPAEGGSWRDWSDIITTELPTTNVYDNFPIKAFADFQDYASIESLSELEARIADAESALASAVVSADGADVSRGCQWVTQEAYDAYAQAIADAKGLLGRAGADYATKLVATTPDQGAVEGGIVALASAGEAHAASMRPGIKAEQATPPADEGQPGVDKGSLAQTGDSLHAVAPLLIMCMLVAATIAIAALVVRRRRC